MPLMAAAFEHELERRRRRPRLRLRLRPHPWIHHEMLQQHASEVSLRITDVIISVGEFLWSDKSSLSRLSMTNRSTYLALHPERTRHISCNIVDTESLYLFLKSRLSRSWRPLVRSLEVSSMLSNDIFKMDTPYVRLSLPPDRWKGLLPSRSSRTNRTQFSRRDLEADWEQTINRILFLSLLGR